ncbi:hypothetical protein ASPACDRAFT_112652 [Aspergillus aculeatus ATCC 16872]|uniref:Iron superoxide dismutase A n=1 Tax=Aspergillus aculeatus (strain ATCC 16872 / CBS 172.66 / WB 5094) TaxID=690307 RepID=A0A1L9X6X3_ASPA1|nr:uncharacterized protein ASPACDRAFT_112652 [Aspergillus aculeatus ATCC 16872]OJK04216.1 hypothetical protein ASPACDRAFT_112652 [Aspergillus aculeatus ATCC 16872]
MSAESPGEKKSGIRAFFAHALRPKKSRQVLRKGYSASTPDLRGAAGLHRPSTTSEDVPPLPSLAPLEAHRLKYRELNANKDSQLGENRDHTAILHTIGDQDFNRYDPYGLEGEYDNRPPGEPHIASLPSQLWVHLATNYLTLADTASLAFSSKTLHQRLEPLDPFHALSLPSHHTQRINFLTTQDRHLPDYLLCIPCARFHRRTHPGHEKLQPADTLNPLFTCPEARNPLNAPPRHRITHNRILPYTFVQLAMRAHRFGPEYGIPFAALSRRWRRTEWSHQTRFQIHNNHLLMRVTSTRFADPGLPPSTVRLLLYSREDYVPYFSVCAHWRDGNLMAACKCALSHIPVPRETAALQGLEHRAKDLLHRRVYNPNALTTLCGKCRPMRRCPECPSEYLIEIKLTEDRSEGSAHNLRFRHAIVVTRWCDLGDGSAPSRSREWAACCGVDGSAGDHQGKTHQTPKRILAEGGPAGEGVVGGNDDDGDSPAAGNEGGTSSSSNRIYDSFKEIGKRSISGTFESMITDDTLPGQRVISMNPSGKKLGEEGNSWY